MQRPRCRSSRRRRWPRSARWMRCRWSLAGKARGGAHGLLSGDERPDALLAVPSRAARRHGGATRQQQRLVRRQPSRLCSPASGAGSGRRDATRSSAGEPGPSRCTLHARGRGPARATLAGMAGRSALRRQRSGWKIREMTFAQAAAEDARRYLGMSPAERARLVPELFAALGIREPPRLRRVYSYPESTPGPVPGDRRLRSRAPRARGPQWQPGPGAAAMGRG